MLKKITRLESLLIVCIVFYLIFQLVLAFYNNLAMDDYEFLEILNRDGFFGSINTWYHDWQGRVSSYFFINLFLSLSEYPFGLLVYQIIYVNLFTVGIFNLFSTLLKLSGVSFSKPELGLITFYFYLFFHELVYTKSTLYWLDASVIYHFMIALTVCLFSLIVSNKKGVLTSFMILILSFITGSSIEHFALILLATLLLGFIMSVAFPENKFFSGTRIKLVVAIAGCSLGVAVLLLSPGLQVRRALYANPDFITSVKISISSFYHYYQVFFLPGLGKLMLLSSPFIYWGAKWRLNQASTEQYKLLYPVLILVMSVTGLICFFFLIMANGTGGIGQPRTLIAITFLISLSACMIAFVAGYSGLIKKNSSMILSAAAVVVLVIILSVNYLRILPESIKYSKSERKRIELIETEKTKNRTELLVLDTLYYNKDVIYLSNELSSYQDSGWNPVTMRVRKLNFYIKTEYPTVTQNISE